MAWIREVQNAKEVVSKELSSLADMFRKYNRDEDKDKDDKGRGGKKRNPGSKKTLMLLGMCFISRAQGLFLRLMFYNCAGLNIGKVWRLKLFFAFFSWSQTA